MITRKVDRDDAQAGFTYYWVNKFGQNIENLYVICLEKGNIDGLGSNIEIFSLGKEKEKNRLKEFINFQKGAIKFIRQVDGIFCHMNPIYTILIAPYAKLFNKKIIAWYSHKAITWQLRLVNFLVSRIVTPTQESLRLKTKKKLIMGHGIDTELFKPALVKEQNKTLQIISVGRISPIKDYKTLILAAKALIDKYDFKQFKISIVGAIGLLNQQEHFNGLKRMTKEYNLANIIKFVGAVPNRQLPDMYQQTDISINLCPTGSPDKAVLESMACALPTLVCNKTFIDDFGQHAKYLIFKEKNAEDLAEKIIKIKQNNELKQIGYFLRQQIIEKHNLNKLIIKILNAFKAIS